jgi:hypothetical protein
MKQRGRRKQRNVDYVENPRVFATVVTSLLLREFSGGTGAHGTNPSAVRTVQDLLPGDASAGMLSRIGETDDSLDVVRHQYPSS